MLKQVLFIQGAGQDAHAEDKKLADGLQRSLGEGYTVLYPIMPDEADPQYEAWSQYILQQLSQLAGPVIVAGHSIGASVLIKCLSENTIDTPITGIFLLAAPFWGGAGWRYDGYEQLEVKPDSTSGLPADAPVFLYHCKDDGIVPYGHLALYEKILPQAASHSTDTGGHQFDNGLSAVAKNIAALKQ